VLTHYTPNIDPDSHPPHTVRNLCDGDPSFTLPKFKFEVNKVQRLIMVSRLMVETIPVSQTCANLFYPLGLGRRMGDCLHGESRSVSQC
jgi:hypothetical protein